MELFKILGFVIKLSEKISQWAKEFIVMIGLNSGIVDIFLEFGERIGVGGFVSIEEFEDILDFNGLELLIDWVEVGGFFLPEFQFFQWAGVISVLQDLLWFQFEDVFDVFGPVDDWAFEDVGFIFVWGGVRGGELGWWKWKHGSSFDETHKDVGLGGVVVEFFHEVFGDEIGPANLVIRILHQWWHDIVKIGIKMFQNIFGYLKDETVSRDVVHA